LLAALTAATFGLPITFLLTPTVFTADEASWNGAGLKPRRLDGLRALGRGGGDFGIVGASPSRGAGAPRMPDGHRPGKMRIDYDEFGQR